jgi:hypothetical protein
MRARQVSDKFQDAKDSREKFLLERGWLFSYDFPDHAGRWCKKFGGREMTLGAAGAFAIERDLE